MATLAALWVGAVLVVFTTLFIGFIISGLIINAIQLVLWLTVKKVSPRLYRKINFYLLTLLWNRKCILLSNNYSSTYLVYLPLLQVPLLLVTVIINTVTMHS